MSAVVTHEETVGFDASFGACFLDTSVFCIRSGNFLVIYAFKDHTVDFLGSVNADLAGFSAFAGSPLSQVLAYAEAISDPTVHIADVKGVEKGSFNIPGVLGIQSLGFSYDGQWLYCLGGLPTFRLSIFDWKNKQEVCYRTSEAPIGTHLSVCPAKSRLFAVYGDSERDVPPVPPQLSPAPLAHLHFFTFQGSGADYSLPSVVSDIPDPVISFCWSCKLYLCFAGTSNGLIYVIDANTGRIQGSAFHLFALEEVDQVAKSLFCTSSYLIVGGSSGHMYWMDLERMKKAEDIVPLDMESPILFQIMFPGSNSLLLGSAANSLLSLDLDPESHAAVEDSIIRLRHCHCGPISAATCLPRHLVTAGRDGTLRFWTFQPYLELIQLCTFGKDVLTAVASSPGGKLVVVGSQSGLVRIINTADVNGLALLLRERLHSDAVTALAVTSTHICSGSADGSLVIFQNNPVEGFPLIGLLQMKTSIISIGAPAPLASAEQLLVATKHREVFRFDIPKEEAPECRIGLEALNRAMLKVGSKITKIKAETTLREGQQYFYCCCEDKTVKYYGMPLSTGDLDIVGVDDVESSAPDDVMTGHMKAVTATDLSPNQVLLATGCAGGSLVVRELDVRTAQVQQTLFNAVHHDPFTGAISSITFVPDGRRFFTVGFDGAINMYSVKHAPIPTPVDGFELPVGCFQNSVSKIFPIENQLNDLPTIWKRRGYDPDMNDPFKSSEDDPGWEDTSLIEQMRLQKQKNQEKEAEAYKEAILNQLQNIRGEFMTLVQENEEAPELEKLTQNDFTLDTVAADRLQQLAQLRVELVHYRRKMKNQIRFLIAQSITDKCFKPYEPRLITLFSFKTLIHFDNFPLPVIDERKQRFFRCVSMLRRCEIAALRYKPNRNDPNRIQPSLARDGAIDGGRYLSSRTNSLIQFDADPEEQLVKDERSLLYDPFQMVTDRRKITQSVIIQHLIFETMNTFNIAFEDMVTKKQNLVQSLEEKNKRIRQLIRILKLNTEDYTIFDPAPQDNEIADAFLTVKDTEVHLRKQLDTGDHEQEQMGEAERDLFAERALRQMMGGSVNMSSMDDAPAEDEPVRPEWMDAKKKEELTEEEQYQIQEFEKKLKNFIEEREKRRKALNAELTKLVKGNISAIDEFDRQMGVVYMQRFQCEERVLYYELEILHQMDALRDESRYRHQLKEATWKAVDTGSLAKEQEARLARMKEMASQHSELAAAAEQSLENLKAQVMKEFRNRECANVLRKLFDGIAKRIVPKVVPGPNVFQQFLQPQFVFADDKRDLLQSQPTSLAESPWRNFLEYCDKKITVARDAAEKSAEATEIKALLRGYDDELEGLRRQLKDLTNRQSEATDKLLLTRVDLHVPFTFRQGQVEIPSDIVAIDYSDVCLIDKKVVMDRNRLILDAGKRKLDELENIRQQRRNHKILKWEIDKCKVDVENLNEEVKEYQLFRVTKMDMELIMGGGKNRNQTEVNSLNNSLQHTQKTHEVRLRRANVALKKLKRKVAMKTAENAKIEEEILRMQLGLKERKRIYNIQMKSSEGVAEARKNRLRQVMTISRLKRMLQVQGVQIGDLKAEVTRLRKCVYASFNEGEDLSAMVGYNTGNKT